jgi:chemotaxis protein methyltransferase CheR
VSAPSPRADDEPAGPSFEPAELDALLADLYARTGRDFRAYLPRAIGRRLHHLMLQEGLADLRAVRVWFTVDAGSAAWVADRLCVNVTSMFRDPHFFQALRDRVVPQLRALRFFRVWSAGCSTGEEAYSLAVLFDEEGLTERCRIYATDIDERALAVATSGVFPLEQMREYSQNYQRAGGAGSLSDHYRTAGDGAAFLGRLRRRIVFGRHNLATDASFNEFQLVLCRNVLIYFDAALQARAHELIRRSLAEGGVLGLGQRESLWPLASGGPYDELDAVQKLYRRGP